MTKNDLLHKDESDIYPLLAACKGLRVTVSLIVGDGYARNDFGSQISTAGDLEVKATQDGDAYRVIVGYTDSDPDGFCYFGIDDVRAVIDRREHVSLDGSKLVIFLDPSAFR
jgi:hypothetical protein